MHHTFEESRFVFRRDMQIYRSFTLVADRVSSMQYKWTQAKQSKSKSRSDALLTQIALQNDADAQLRKENVKNSYQIFSTTKSMFQKNIYEDVSIFSQPRKIGVTSHHQVLEGVKQLYRNMLSTLCKQCFVYASLKKCIANSKDLFCIEDAD